MYFIIISATILIGVIVFWLILKSKNMQIWFLSYLKQQLASQKNISKTKHIYVCLADHYEPYLDQVDQTKAHARVQRWVNEYPKIAKMHSDSNGRPPQHSYFYPEEEYDEWVMQQIKSLCEQDLGDLDIHLHHDNDTAENLHETLVRFKTLLHEKHGFLRKDSKGEIVFGFIHGNWALDNSRPDGKWCGVNNEIEVLINSGCVFDMTMPSAPSDTQTSTINSIYFAKDDGCAKSHDKGRPLEKGDWSQDDELLMIQGPLSLDWQNRKFGIVPRIEAGEISYDAPPRKQRIMLWEDCAVTIKGAEEHVFIKLHTHGLDDLNSDMFFDLNGFETLWSELEARYKDQKGYQLHYVTAWEMYKKIEGLSHENS
jgi:hypothetical protein